MTTRTYVCSVVWCIKYINVVLSRFIFSNNVRVLPKASFSITLLLYYALYMAYYSFGLMENLVRIIYLVLACEVEKLGTYACYVTSS